MAPVNIRDLNNVLAFVEILEGTAEKVLKQISSIENEHVASTLFLPTARSYRATRNKELTEIGAAYSAQALALKSLEQKIAQQRHKLDQMSAKHYNATCPIGSVPMEIMHQILLFAAEGTPTKLIPVAPLVCQFWNKALASLSVVWNDCRSRSNDSDCLAVPLRRAGPKANVTLLQNNIPKWLSDPYLTGKISTLTLSTLSPLSDLETFCTTSLPNLVTLTLRRTTLAPPTYGGDIILPTHLAPRLRRVVIDSIPFNFIKISPPCSCCAHSTIETIEIHNTPLFLPYLYKSLQSFKKLRQLRLIKISEGDPVYEIDEDTLDDDLPASVDVLLLHQCDWDSTCSFFEANAFAKLRELRLAFPTFDSDPLFDFAHRDTHLSNIQVGELSPAALCCIGLSDALAEMSQLKVFSITSPDGMLRRVIRSIMEDDNGTPLAIQKLPNMTHFEIKVSNGHPCEPLGLHPMFHCMCSLNKTTLLDDIVKVLYARVLDGKLLNLLKISSCLVKDREKLEAMTRRLTYFKCRCS